METFQDRLSAAIRPATHRKYLFLVSRDLQVLTFKDLRFTHHPAMELASTPNYQQLCTHLLLRLRHTLPTRIHRALHHQMREPYLQTREIKPTE